MNHTVSIHQLGTSGRAFLNVREDAHGGIGVWGTCYGTPTYLLRNGYSFELIQFDSQTCADEWLAKNPGSVVVKLEEAKE